MLSTSTYVTTQGETPDRISYNLWGDETLFHKLVEANPEIRGQAILSGGIVLDVPDIEPRDTEVAPPWRQS